MSKTGIREKGSGIRGQGSGIRGLGNGVFRVERHDGTHVTAYGVADGSKVWVFVDGETFIVDSAPRRRGGGGQDAAALSAPMPATVTQVHVTPGQQVRAGDVLVTLEAMKMELPIRAITDGTVTAVNCRATEMVQPGTPLVEVTPNLEPEPEPDPEPEPEPEHEPGTGNQEP